MRKNLLIAATFAIVVNSASAAVITIDWTDGGNGVTNASLLGGFIQGANIQNIAANSGPVSAKSNTVLTNLKENTGVFSGVSVSAASGWAAGSFTSGSSPNGYSTSADWSMMQNWSKTTNGSITFTGLSSWLALNGASAYNVYVMSDAIGGTALTGSYSIGAEQYYLTNGGAGASAAGPYALGSNTTLAGAQGAANTANYVKFSNLTGNAFTLNVLSNDANMVNINMMQIEAVSAPEPSVAMLGGLGALALLRRRRNESIFIG